MFASVSAGGKGFIHKSRFCRVACRNLSRESGYVALFQAPANYTVTINAKVPKKVRKALFTIIPAALACLLLSGCSADRFADDGRKGFEEFVAGNDDTIQVNLTELLPLTPAIAPFLKTNPLTIKLESPAQPQGGWQEVILIEGLTDKNVENAINKKLTETYTGLKEKQIPPYRGIYQIIPRGSQPDLFDIFATPTFNYEQILSVSINSTLTYDLTEDRMQAGTGPQGEASFPYPSGLFSVGVTECHTFDLRNGREILLPEIFADPATAMADVNDAVASILAMESYDPEGFYYSAPLLASSFKGLPPDQKYYLSESGINLVIDYINLEFDVLFFPAQFYLPFTLFDGKLALGERFAADAALIYDTPELQEYHWVIRDAQPGNTIIEYADGDISEGLNTYIFFRYPEDLPANIETYILKAKNKSLETLAELGTRPTGGEEDSRYYDFTLTVNCPGPYYTMRESMFLSGAEGETFYVNYQTFTTSGLPLDLADCFAPGYDYKKQIHSAYLEQAVNFGLEPVSFNQLFDQLTFIFGPAELEFTLSGQDTYILYFIPYRDFGFENLTIFKN